MTELEAKPDAVRKLELGKAGGLVSVELGEHRDRRTREVRLDRGLGLAILADVARVEQEILGQARVGRAAEGAMA